MSGEIAKIPVDPTQFPEAANRFAKRALREHLRAENDVVNAVQHAVKSGTALLKAYELCERGQWCQFFALHFRSEKDEKLSLRTAQKYMQLARDWALLTAQHPEGFSSQRQAMKALKAIVRADEGNPRGASRAARKASENDRGAARGANASKVARTGPVWRASGPFVQEALRLVSSVDTLMRDLVAKGYGLAVEAAVVHDAATRLQEMLHKDLDEAEAEQAAGRWTWVAEQPSTNPCGSEGRITPPAKTEVDHDE